MEIIIKGKLSADPRDRVLAVEAAAQAICMETKGDSAEAVMMLLTAAVHLSQKHARPGTDIEMVLAECLGTAIVASDDFFKLRKVAPHTKT